MGRAFEYRKATKMKRWANMAKVFTKIGKEIAIAVKEGGPDPINNPRLRVAVQNSKAANMPKVNVENAIKRATSKDSDNYSEMVYEGYAPHGVAIMVETLTDNPTRTVANVRAAFSKCNGSLGSSGNVDFMFNRKAVFTIPAAGINPEEFEMEMIDYGLDELKVEDDGTITLYSAFTDYGTMQKGLEERNIEATNTEFQRIPTVLKELTDEQAEDVIKLIERLEDEDDVSNVFTNMA